MRRRSIRRSRPRTADQYGRCGGRVGSVCLGRYISTVIGPVAEWLTAAAACYRLAFPLRNSTAAVLSSPSPSPAEQHATYTLTAGACTAASVHTCGVVAVALLIAACTCLVRAAGSLIQLTRHNAVQGSLRYSEWKSVS